MIVAPFEFDDELTPRIEMSHRVEHRSGVIDGPFIGQFSPIDNRLDHRAKRCLPVVHAVSPGCAEGSVVVLGGFEHLCYREDLRKKRGGETHGRFQ
ncbi:MAG: hypothetical protein R2845_07865 [Thermomicrobiales bacterium]